jgi:hypothetical protein
MVSYTPNGYANLCAWRIHGWQTREGRTMTDLMALFSTCVGRRDDYALQNEWGRYTRVGAPLTEAVLQAHLEGTHTIGTYVIDEGGLCHFAVFDVDAPDGFMQLGAIQERLASAGIVSYVELSRRSGHVWVFLRSPAPPLSVRRWLLPYCPASVELYPKQDAQVNYGSLIRVPLGVHRRSRQWYPFVRLVNGIAVPVATSIPDLLVWLASVERVSVPAFACASSALAPGSHTHPSFSKTPALVSSVSASGAAVAPSYSIRRWCAEQDYYALISRYVALSETGVGCCPFGDHHRNGRDEHPSFKVYTPGVPGGYCWYCYTWGRGGSVFDFLRYTYRMSPRALWHAILSGAEF